jgi:hypothetical protein
MLLLTNTRERDRGATPGASFERLCIEGERSHGELRVVVLSRLFGADWPVVLAGEVDGRLPSEGRAPRLGDLVELKACHAYAEIKWFKFFDYWAQCALVGVPHLWIGRYTPIGRDGVDATLDSIEMVRVSDIQAWLRDVPQRAIGLTRSVLDMVARSLPEDDRAEHTLSLNEAGSFELRAPDGAVRGRIERLVHAGEDRSGGVSGGGGWRGRGRGRGQ